jgi:hypothetical protein
MKDPSQRLFISQSVNYRYDSDAESSSSSSSSATSTTPPIDRSLAKVYNTFGIQVLTSFEDSHQKMKCKLVSFNSIAGLSIPDFFAYMILAKVSPPAIVIALTISFDWLSLCRPFILVFMQTSRRR